MPLFSVIIPVYNRLALLPATLGSVFDQTFRDFEVIVVDDGSTDGSPEWIAAQPLPIRLIRQENKGPGPARNLALSHASGEYVAFLDSDDVWFAWTLAVYATLLGNVDRPKLIAASLVEFTEPAELLSITREADRIKSYPDFLTAAAQDGVFMGAGMACIHRETLLQAGGFPLHRFNAEDHDLALRLGEAPGFAVVQKPVLLGYRRHPGSVRADHQRSISGIRYLLRQERAGHYPGGPARTRDRQAILSRHVRPIALESARAGYFVPALTLYLQSLTLQIGQHRWKFVLVMPVMLLIGLIRRMARPKRT